MTNYWRTTNLHKQSLWRVTDLCFPLLILAIWIMDILIQIQNSDIIYMNDNLKKKKVCVCVFFICVYFSIW